MKVVKLYIPLLASFVEAAVVPIYFMWVGGSAFRSTRRVPRYFYEIGVLQSGVYQDSDGIVDVLRFACGERSYGKVGGSVIGRDVAIFGVYVQLSLFRWFGWFFRFFVSPCFLFFRRFRCFSMLPQSFVSLGLGSLCMRRPTPYTIPLPLSEGEFSRRSNSKVGEFLLWQGGRLPIRVPMCRRTTIYRIRVTLQPRH